jgi:flavorubredoxin
LGNCPQNLTVCPINDILNFHRAIMPSRKALRYALEQLLQKPFETIAPQHGSIITDKKAMKYIVKLLISLQRVGIDGLIDNQYEFNFSNLDGRFET